MTKMRNFAHAKCLIILQFALLTYQYPANRKDDIDQTKDSCHQVEKERIQFSEFHPDHSAEEYELPLQDEVDFTFDLSFCTRSKMAIIAELTNSPTKQTLSIQIVDGFLSVSVEEFENPRPRCYWTFSDEPINDGTLHKVKIKVSSQLLSIELYRMYKLIGIKSSLRYNSCLSNNTISRLHSLVLGGVIIDRDADNKVQVLYSFVGCMKNIRLNGSSINDVAKQLTSEDVTPGCPEFHESCTEACPPMAQYKDGSCVCPEGTEMDSDDTCSPSCSCITCTNGKKCYSSGSETHCACPSGFYGDRCEVILSPCDGDLCNNGSCIIDDDSATIKCICVKGYKGKFYNKKDMCFFNPCHNNGTCQESSENDVICLCPPGVSRNVSDERLDISEGKNISTALRFSAIGGICLIILIVTCTYIWKNHKRLPCLKTDEKRSHPARTSTWYDVTMNSNNLNNENSPSLNKISSDEEGDAKLYIIKSHEVECDKITQEFHGVRDDEETSYEDVHEPHSMKVHERSSGKEAQEDEGSFGKEVQESKKAHSMKDDEGSSGKEVQESHSMKVDEGSSGKEVQESKKAHSMKVDGGSSGKEVQESHIMKDEEECCDEEEEDSERNSTDSTVLNEPEKEEETGIQENSVSQCQQNAISLATEGNEIFV